MVTATKMKKSIKRNNWMKYRIMKFIWCQSYIRHEHNNNHRQDNYIGYQVNIYTNIFKYLDLKFTN